MRTSALAAGIVAVLIAAYFLFFDQDPAENHGSAENGSSAPAQPEVVDAAPARPEAADAPAIERVQAAPTAPSSAPTLAQVPADYAGPWLTVEVVLGEEERPVPAALVTAMTPDESRQEEIMMLFLSGTTVSRMLEAFGENYPTDASGRARIPLPRNHGFLAATTEDLFGLSEWDPGAQSGNADATLRLRVDPSASVRVEVVDGAGQPLAGVPVAIRLGDVGFSFDLLRERTGSDGRAHFMHAAAFLGEMMPEGFGGFQVALATPLPEPVFAPCDLQEPPQEPLRLVMPDHGAVEVRVIHADGRAPEDGQLVFLAAEAEEDEYDFLPAGMPVSGAAAVGLVGGVARFDYVGLGLQLAASTRFPGAPSLTETAEPGPGHAGELRAFELVEVLDYPILIGRLLDETGAALSGRSIVLELEDGNRSDFFDPFSPGEESETDAAGAFRLALSAEHMQALPQRAAFRIDGGDGAPAMQAEFTLPRLRVGENDLGELQAVAAPLLASGRVVGADGAPLADASVTPMSWYSWDEDDPTHGDWNQDWERRIECETDGRFVLHGAADPHGLRLQVEAIGFIAREVELPPGTEDCEIRLDVAGELSGRLLLDEGIPVSELHLSLTLLDSGPDGESSHWSSPDDDGAFSFGGLPHGFGRLTVATDWGEDEDTLLAAVDGIAFGPGVAADPRLDPIDLRGRIHMVRIHARGEDGSTIQAMGVRDAEDPSRYWWGQRGEVVALSARPIGELVISAAGWRTARATAAGDAVEVVMRPGPEVLLTIPPGAARVGDIRLGASLAIAEEGFEEWSEGSGSGFFGGDGTLILRVSDPGDYSVTFIAQRAEEPDPEEWDFSWLQPEDGDSPRIAVRDVAGRQVFALAPPAAEAIRRAVEADEAGGDTPLIIPGELPEPPYR